MSQEIETTNFDFNVVPEGVRKRAQQLDTQMGDAVQRLSFAVEEIGEICIEMKSLLPRGTFMEWHESKGLTSNQAVYAMRRVREKEQGALAILEFQELETKQIPKQAESVVEETPSYTDEELEAARQAGREEGRKEQAQIDEEKLSSVVVEANRRITGLKNRVGEVESQLTFVQQSESDQSRYNVLMQEHEDLLMELQKAKDDLQRVQTKNRELKQGQSKQASLPRMRDLQGETQQRVLNDWATATHVCCMSLDSFMAHIPDVVSVQQFDGDAWQRLSEVETSLKLAGEKITWLKSMRDYANGSVVDADAGYDLNKVM